MSGARLSPVIETDLEPGDRFEVKVIEDQSGVRLPVDLAWSDGWTLEDAAGRELAARSQGEQFLHVSGLGALLERDWQAVWLQCVEADRFRLSVERLATPEPAAEIVTEQGVRIELASGETARLRDGSQPPASLAEFDLAVRAARLATHAGFDRLICLPLVRDMELLEHQTRTAKTVLRRLRGRALLCDEVGLGKTIEAGLVLSELHLRGLARSILVLVPPSLIEQWQGEMRRKFSIDLVSHDAPEFRGRGPDAWQTFDHIICSIHTAKREPHRSAILRRRWDLVVVDEAHHLRNRATQLWRFASEIEKHFLLLLTATPVQNNLEELFNLVTLLEPGLLSTAKRFGRHFVDRKDKLTPRHVDELHQLLAEVMVRNRRSTVGLQFTRRYARTELVPMSASEQALYGTVADFVRRHLRERGKGAGPMARMALVALQMALGSSSQAAAGTLERMAEHENLAPTERDTLLDFAATAQGQTDSAKVDRLLGLLNESHDKLVLFTQFRATQDMLVARLRDAGHDVAVFHGGLSRLAKAAAVERFRGSARLLLCTESGSEGRNLQFAHALCNFDLPWNPMKIEQRIGRLSRIGQTHDVYVYNLVAAGTVEAAVLHLLEAKLNLFELVIGEIDMILGNLDEEREFQEVVADLWGESADADDFGKRMEDLGSRLLAAKEAYFAQKEADDRLFADRFSPDR